VSVVLFDLGNTLVRYFERAEFPVILEQAILEVQGTLRERGLLTLPPELVWQRVAEENHEAGDHRVRPLDGRLARIFGLGAGQVAETGEAICRAFLRPIFARGRCYEDSLPVLRALRSRGIRTAIVSNTPWGSPAGLWREEIERLGPGELVDIAVFCTDVGWRKPARPIFDYVLDELQVHPEDCLFVGDDPRWDLAGPQATGIEAILIDRRGSLSIPDQEPIRSLHELLPRLDG
jgi:putative hydrolase of the HAD superfamily